MLNYLAINFFLRKSLVDPKSGAVYVRVTVNKKRLTLGAVTTISGLELPKSLKIAGEHWDIGKARVKPASPHARQVNEAIVECERKLNKLYQQHEGFDVKMTAMGVKASLLCNGRMLPSMPDLMDLFLKERISIGTKASTVDTYRFKFRPLLAFLKHEKTTDKPAEDFSAGMLKRYRTYLIGERGNSSRSADKTCQVVKTLLLWASEHEIIRSNPLLYVRVRVDKTPNLECLEQSEVAMIRQATLTPALRIAADCFVFACHTGLAYQDMKAITANSMQVVHGQHCLVGSRMKTGTEYCIPISEVVWELIDRYSGPVMPLPKLGNYNPLLRQIMLTLGIDKRITSHTARKTFCDWCINELNLSEEATIVAMGQKSAKELTPYRKTRPKRLLSEFPADLLRPVEQRDMPGYSRIADTPFIRVA
ncbi:phage integrase SAM-like domain-containing protein [Spirosoma arcticum]